MKQSKCLWLALAFLLQLVLAANAFAIALPDVSLSLGAAYPLHLQFGDNKATITTIESTSGNSLSSNSGMSILLLTVELSSLGTYLMMLLRSKTEGKECSTNGDEAGVVLLAGEFHVVLLNGNRLAALLLQPHVTIECATTKVKIEGLALGSFESTGTEATELTQLGYILKGNGAGKPALKEYINDEDKLSNALLLTNFGAGFFESSINIGEEITLTTLESKMFVITSR
jgi:hypothetical protein